MTPTPQAHEGGPYKVVDSTAYPRQQCVVGPDGHIIETDRPEMLCLNLNSAYSLAWTLRGEEIAKTLREYRSKGCKWMNDQYHCACPDEIAESLSHPSTPEARNERG